MVVAAIEEKLFLAPQSSVTEALGSLPYVRSQRAVKYKSTCVFAPD